MIRDIKLIMAEKRLFRPNTSFVVFGVAAAILITTCSSVGSDGYLVLGKAFALRLIVLSCVIVVGFHLLGNLKVGDTDARPHGMKTDRILKDAAIILMCWIPWLIALYPANYLGDTIISIGWVFKTLEGSTGLIYDHNPVLTIYVFGAVALFGRFVIHNMPLAFFCFVILQSWMCSLALSLMANYARSKLCISAMAFRVTMIFICICPLFPIWNNYLSKDSMNAPFLVVWFVIFVEEVRTNGRIFENSKTRCIQFMVISLMVCLTKKLGAYVIFPPLVILLFRAIWQSRARRKQVGVASLALVTVIPAAIVFVLLPHVVFPLAGIALGERYESLAVPLQQTARYVIDHGDDVTDEEHEEIDALLGYQTLSERYVYWLADPVKSKITEPTDAYGPWLHAYVAEGLRHPLCYLESFVALEKGFGAEGSAIYVRTDSSDMGDFDSVGMSDAYVRTGLSQKMSELASNLYAWVSAMPAIDIAFQCSTYAVLLPAFLFGMTFSAKGKRRTALALCSLPVFLSCVGVWLSPISISFDGGRYLIPLIFLSPLMLLIPLSSGFREEPPVRETE